MTGVADVAHGAYEAAHIEPEEYTEPIESMDACGDIAGPGASFEIGAEWESGDPEDDVLLLEDDEQESPHLSLSIPVEFDFTEDRDVARIPEDLPRVHGTATFRPRPIRGPTEEHRRSPALALRVEPRPLVRLGQDPRT